MMQLSSLEVLSAICSSMRSFLGPDQRMKCIIEDEDSCLVSSCSELLCSLDVEHPVGRVAVEALMAHQKSHGTGTTTMMTMAGLWATEIQSLIAQGIPMPAIITYGDECLEQCLSSLESTAVPCTKLLKFSDKEVLSDAKPQDNTCTSSKWSKNCEDNSSATEQLLTHDQFVEVQFSNQCDEQSISRPTKFESAAELPESNLLGDSSLQINDDDDDDVSWFFEGTSQGEGYSLEQHKSECEAILNGVGEGKSDKDGLESTASPTEIAIRRTWQEDSDDEFDSCFPSQEKDTIRTDKENPVRQPTLDYSDDEFDACFPVEVPTTSQKIRAGESTNGILSVADYSNNQHADEFDVNSATKSLEANHPAEKLEHHQIANFNVSRHNMDFNTQDHSTRANCQSAILESLLETKQEKVLSKRLSSVHNNSRHFRSFETAMDQHINQVQGPTSGCHGNKAASEIPNSEEDCQLTCQTADSQHKGGSLPDPSPECGKSAATEPEQGNVSGMQKVIKDLVEARTKQIAARRLVSVHNSSRHFRTMEFTDVQKADMTSGQGSNPEATLATSKVSDEHQRNSSSRDECLESRLSGSQVELFSKTNMNTATNQTDLRDSDKQQLHNIEQLGFGLSHGSDLEMSLVIEAFKMQMDVQGIKDTKGVPDLNRLNVCTVAGPPASASHFQVGLLLPVDPCQRTVVAESEGKCLRALLVNGDATPTFKHAGYKNKVKRTTVDTWKGMQSTQEKPWLGEIVILLEELDVKLLLLKGHADEHLINHCLSKKILLLQDVPYKSLLGLGEACSAPILTYLADATVDDTACGITVACWESGWEERTRAGLKLEGLRRKMFARVCVDGKMLQTAVLCHPASSLLPASQTRFWASAHRLQAAVADGCFLPGAGLPEQMAIKQLLRLNDLTRAADNHGNLSCFKSSIVSAFVEGFIHYLIQVLKNMGTLDNKALAKARIMSGLQKDKLEPVLSSSILPEPLIGTGLPDHTLNPTGWNWPEPNKTCQCRFNAPACKPSDNLTYNSRSLQAENKRVECLLETEPSSSRTDATLIKNSLTSSREKTSVGCDGNSVVYDNYTGKRTAWENAWALLKTVLRIDAHIVTGVTGQDKSGSSAHIENLVIL